MTAVSGSVYTAAQFNTFVRDNLNETAPAKATSAGNIFVSDGVNSIVEREVGFDEVTTSQSTSSLVYTDLATVGPQVTVTTGTRALYIITVQTSHSVSDSATRASVDISGASAIAASDNRELVIDGLAAGNPMSSSWVHMERFLTPGSNTFTLKYRVSAGTGTWAERRLTVIPL